MVQSRKSSVAYVDSPILDGDDLPSHLDLIAFCQLRWNLVWQRPQHLMSRWGKTRRVFFVEEPIIGGPESFGDVSIHNGVHVFVPHLRDGFDDYNEEMKKLLDHMMEDYKIESYICWYWTPMALTYTRHLSPQITIYDCMNELSAFADSPSLIRQFEKELLARAELVFTGEGSLYEARRYQHPNIHEFPSGIDAAHFNQARFIEETPEDQKEIPFPLLGFLGVINERMDFDLLKGIANAKPDWHYVLIGPLTSLSPDCLPQSPNIHYLGPKKHDELPAYLAGWQVALLPLARKDATRNSPTKTPEYLAAGRPVVSTSIPDVVHPYGEMKLVHIADSIEMFVKAIEEASHDLNDKRWLNRVDAFLEGTSWDRTWSRMNRLMYQTLKSKRLTDNSYENSYKFNFISEPSI